MDDLLEYVEWLHSLDNKKESSLTEKKASEETSNFQTWFY